jgi:hypothetical protein
MHSPPVLKSAKVRNKNNRKQTDEGSKNDKYNVIVLLESCIFAISFTSWGWV